MAYQKRQADSMVDMADAIGDQIAKKISENVAPYFERMNETIANFADVASKSQVDGVGTLIDKFVSEMNQSLGDNFQELGKVIEDTCEWQKRNGEYMQDILEKIGSMTHNIQEINELSEHTVENLAKYVNQIENLQGIINENFMSVNLQMENNAQMIEKQQGYIDILVEYEKNISESSSQFTQDMVGQIEILQKMENEIACSTRENIEEIAKKSEECSLSIAEVAKQQIQDILNLATSATGNMDSSAQELARVSQQLNGQLIKSLNDTFDTFDKNLAEITRHLSGTIAEVDNTTERVPQVVSAAYEGMERSLIKMQDDLEILVHSMDVLRRNANSVIGLFENEE
jgi:ABC-type transporter Mla subunit MlaD